MKGKACNIQHNDKLTLATNKKIVGYFQVTESMRLALPHY